MVQRSRVSRNTLMALVAVVYLVSPSAHAQQQNASGGAGQSPRTPWGDPDLQGLWNNATITPLQRPESLGDKAFLTAEEVAAMEQRAAAGFSQANTPRGADRTTTGRRRCRRLQQLLD